MKFTPISFFLLGIFIAGCSGNILPSKNQPGIQSPVSITEYTFPYDFLIINDLYFQDQNNGWAVGRLDWYEPDSINLSCCKAKIFKTNDGGANWNEIEIGNISGILNSITFIDEMNGYAAGQEFFGEGKTIILKTTDGGKSWMQENTSQINGSLNSVIISKNDHVWSVGRNFSNSHSLILNNTADGASWKIQEHPSHSDGEVTAINFPSNETGYAVGYVGHDNPKPYIIKSMDGGNNWVELDFPSIIGWLSDVVFVDDATGYIIGNTNGAGIIATTKNGGESWQINNFKSDIWSGWIYKTDQDLLLYGNCSGSENCKNVISIFNGKEFVIFESLAFQNETITATGNPTSYGSIVFVTNTKSKNSEKHKTTFYRYDTP